MALTRDHLRRAISAVMLVAATIGCAPTGAPRTTPTASTTLPGFRVLNTATARTVPFDNVITAATHADIVFFGEEHDDPETHFAELALLEAIGRNRGKVILSMEMFERDVQPILDDYLAGRVGEKDFLAKTRPWDNYPDYRPLVQLAKARGWPVIAADIPRPIATAVSHAGLTMLDTLPTQTRAFVAREIACPHDAYYDRFSEEMNGHDAGGGGQPGATNTVTMRAMTDRFFDAQCIKDETMAESITRVLAQSGSGTIVVHFTGSFHTDQGLGTADRVRRRAPAAKQLLITAVPVPNPATGVDSTKGKPRADFLIFTRAPSSK